MTITKAYLWMPVKLQDALNATHNKIRKEYGLIINRSDIAYKLADDLMRGKINIVFSKIGNKHSNLINLGDINVKVKKVKKW